MVIKLRTSRNKITSVEIASVTLTLSLSENGETVTSHPPTGSRDIYLKALFMYRRALSIGAGGKSALDESTAEEGNCMNPIISFYPH
ncbi:hypothetical protein CEXT_63831 [Caerostris extrusa]|uniref:Uncharacterized protein n=1 Tax=Caerostris extrusa TaxID=172846 RepID=A0AAV4P4V9_CAEEX|nr:hypothetical protein CEXT_63831 [Caerostris extrusa]